MKKLTVLAGASRDKVRLQILMRNGQKSTETIEAPIPYVSGMSKLGRFHKKLHEIERIVFR